MPIYHVQVDGTRDCPDYQHRAVPCKHVHAVLIHARAQELVAPSPSPTPTAAAASAPALTPTTEWLCQACERWFTTSH
jgi:hypothetical protein